MMVNDILNEIPCQFLNAMPTQFTNHNTQCIYVAQEIILIKTK